MKRVLDACCGSRMFYFDKENGRKSCVKTVKYRKLYGGKLNV